MDSFDSLKREATKLERSLEDKVARYQQVTKEYCTFCADTGTQRSRLWSHEHFFPNIYVTAGAVSSGDWE